MSIGIHYAPCPGCGTTLKCKAAFARDLDGVRVGLNFDSARCPNTSCDVNWPSDGHIVNRAEDAVRAAYVAAGVVDLSGHFPDGSPERR